MMYAEFACAGLIAIFGVAILREMRWWRKNGGPPPS